MTSCTPLRENQTGRVLVRRIHMAHHNFISRRSCAFLIYMYITIGTIYE